MKTTGFNVTLLSFFIFFQSLISFGQRITTLVGGIGDDRPAVNAQLLNPMELAINKNGDVFIADAGNRRIRKIDALSGVISTVAGNGQFGSAGDGGLAVNAQLYDPVGVALDDAGNLFIADRGLNVIRKVDFITGLISTIAGLSGGPGFGGDGALAKNATLGGPRSIVIDKNNNLFIAEEWGHRIRKIEHSTGLITTVAGSGVIGFGGDNGPASSALLHYPSGLAVDHLGNLLIADRGNNRIRKIDVSDNKISSVAGNGTLGLNGDNGLAVIAELSGPTAIAIDLNGNFFIGDSETRVRKVNAQNGIISTVVGLTYQGFLGDGGSASSALIRYPRSLGFDSNGNLYISDYGNGRIRKVDPAQMITSIAGNGGYGGDGGLSGSATLNGPKGVAIDSENNLLVGDVINCRIRKVNYLTGKISTIAGTGERGFSGDSPQQALDIMLGFPHSIAVDPNDNIYFADAVNSRIRKINGSTGVVTTIAGNGSFGFNGDNILATDASLNAPDGISIDANGNIYFSDTFNHRARKISAGTNIITTVAGIGTSGFSGDTGQAINAQLSYPSGIAIKADKLFISDKSNNRIRSVDLNTGIIVTYAGGGFLQADNELALSTDLGFPTGLTVDPKGNLVIVSEGLGKVRKVDMNTNLITTLAGTVGGYSGDNGPATLAHLLYTSSAAFDSNGNLYISDTGNNRIRKVAEPLNQTLAFSPLSPKTFGDAPITLSATATSGLSVSYTSSDETVATIFGSIVTVVGAGSTNITAKQAGDIDYHSAPGVVQVLSVNKANQTITFLAIPTRIFGEVPFNLSATATSGLAIQYSTTSDKISISGNQVTLVKPGNVSIKADQVGNTNYNATASVSQTFCINPSKPIITATGLNSGTPVLTSSSSTGNQWYKNGTLIVGATSNAFTPIDDGSYTVKVTVDNCSSELSAEQILVITGDISSISASEFFIYPNPVKDNLMINLTAFDATSEVEIIMYDASGRKVEKFFKRGAEANFPVSSYPSGTYSLKVSQRNQIYFARFVKE